VIVPAILVVLDDVPRLTADREAVAQIADFIHRHRASTHLAG
jgi:hypothetical protein